MQYDSPYLCARVTFYNTVHMVSVTRYLMDIFGQLIVIFRFSAGCSLRRDILKHKLEEILEVPITLSLSTSN